MRREGWRRSRRPGPVTWRPYWVDLILILLSPSKHNKLFRLTKTHPQCRAAFVHIHSPDVLFSTRQGILCQFPFQSRMKKGKEHFFIIAGLWNCIPDWIQTSWRSFCCFLVLCSLAAITTTRYEHMIYDMFCSGHFSFCVCVCVCVTIDSMWGATYLKWAIKPLIWFLSLLDPIAQLSSIGFLEIRLHSRGRKLSELHDQQTPIAAPKYTFFL